MRPEFAGIERRLQRLDDCIQKLEALKDRPRAEFAADSLLRDIAERNLEVAAQCCIDIANRIISLEGALKARDNYDSLLRMGELHVVEPSFAQSLAPLGGLRNVLVHEYLEIDWDEAYAHLQRTSDLLSFADAVRRWLGDRSR